MLGLYFVIEYGEAQLKKELGHQLRTESAAQHSFSSRCVT
jgi:hypothetical protein